MLYKSLEEERAPGVDERLARVVRIIVEQYDGDVKAFVESNRYRIEANRKAEVVAQWPTRHFNYAECVVKTTNETNATKLEKQSPKKISLDGQFASRSRDVDRVIRS